MPMEFQRVGSKNLSKGKQTSQSLTLDDKDVPSPGCFTIVSDRPELLVINHPQFGPVVLRLGRVDTYIPAPDDPTERMFGV